MITQFTKDDGGRLREYNMKPLKKNLDDDCVVRAIASALNQSYKTTLIDLCGVSIATGFTPTNDKTYERYLTDKGWVKQRPLRDANGKKLQLFNWDHHITPAIIITSGHLTCFKNGHIHDTFDCRRYYANSYYINKEEL